LGLITRESIEEVRRANDLVEVVGGYIPLQKRGGAFWACCPFHDEKTPSFQVHPVRQTYKCFGCGEFGSVIDFVLKHERLDFVETIEKLAARAAVTLKYESGGPSPAERSLRGRALDIMDWAQRGFAGNLKRTPEALEYLEARGLGGEVAERWGIGYAPDAWERLTEAALKHFRDEEALLATGLTRRNERGKLYDFFRGRVTFPIRDAQQRIVGFGARVLDPDAKTQKYVNSAEGLLFHKSKVLYAMDRLAQSAKLKETGRVLLMEGYTDVIAAHEAGFDNAVAPLGTALTREQLTLLRRYDCGVTLVLDGDDAGLKAAERSVNTVLQAGVDGLAAVIEGAKDPFDLLRNVGVEALEGLLEKAQPVFDFKLSLVKRRYDFTQPQGLISASEELAELFASVDDERLRESFKARIVNALGLSASNMTLAFNKAREQHLRQLKRDQGQVPHDAADEPDAVSASDARIVYERTLLRRLMAYPVALHAASQTLLPEAFSTPGLQSLYRGMCNYWDEHNELEPAALVGELSEAGRRELGRVLEPDLSVNQAADLGDHKLPDAAMQARAEADAKAETESEKRRLLDEIQRMARHTELSGGMHDLKTLRSLKGRNRA
jgi:DNA primase